MRLQETERLLREEKRNKLKELGQVIEKVKPILADKVSQIRLLTFSRLCC